MWHLAGKCGSWVVSFTLKLEFKKSVYFVVVLFILRTFKTFEEFDARILLDIFTDWVSLWSIDFQLDGYPKLKMFLIFNQS